LTGCAKGPTTVTKFQHFTTPEELRHCQPQPKAAKPKSDQQLAGYILDLRGWGTDCSDRMERRNQIEDAVKP
jgi:hypothetical protein